jgi:hypothetical protein
MSLFTSSFRSEIKVIAAVLFALIICELSLRQFETLLSLDLKHIRTIPRLAENLAKDKGTKILFLGNSFTRATVDPEIFREEMKSRGFENLAVQLVHPDATRINEWYYTFKTYFVEPQLQPDVLVIITGRAHLHDQPADPVTMGAYYSSKSDVLHFLGKENLDLDDKVDFLLGRYSAAYANRRRIEPRVFSRIIPHYQNCIQRINQLRTRNPANVRRAKALTFARVEKLLDLAENNSVRIIVATVPMSEPYVIDPKIKELVTAHKMTFVEANRIEGIDSSRFPDGYHIDKIGAEKYTRTLAAKFADIFSTDPRFQNAK